MKDHFSKFCQLYPLTDKRSETVAHAIAQWISWASPPKIIQAGNSGEFKGVLTKLLKSHGIRIVNGKPRTPRTQGLVEQANEAVKQKIIAWKLQHGYEGWAAGLSLFALQINRTWHQSVKQVPFEVVFGRKPEQGTIVMGSQRQELDVEEEDPLPISEDLEDEFANGRTIVFDIRRVPIAEEPLGAADEEIQSSNDRDSEEERLMERELENLKRTRGKADPLWYKEPDLVSMSRTTQRELQRRLELGERVEEGEGEDEEENIPVDLTLQHRQSLQETQDINLRVGKDSSISLPISRCKCKGPCNCRRCPCRKEEMQCTVSCHEGHQCENMALPAAVTLKMSRKRAGKRKRTDTVTGGQAELPNRTRRE
jgi:hypothetical protein